MPVDVALTDLQESAVRAQCRKALGDRLARQRVEHDVYAVAVGGGQHLVGERQGPRVRDVLDAECTQVLSFLRGASGGVHRRAQPARDLDRRKTDATGRRVDEDALAMA